MRTTMPDSNSLNLDPPLADEPNEGINKPLAAHAAQSAQSASVTSNSDVLVINKRSAARIMVSGRAMAMTSNGVIAQGKVIDVSETGMCVLMDDKPANKQIVILDCNIYHNGKPHLFQIKALTVYAILASGRFKVGFQFEPNSPFAKKLIEQLSA